MPNTKKANSPAPKKAPDAKNPKRFYLGLDPNGEPMEITPELYNDFDESRLNTRDVNYSNFNSGNLKVENYKSDWFYLDDEGEECIFYFVGPTQTCFAPSYQYPMTDDKTAGAKPKAGKPSEEKQAETNDPTKRKGIQMGYPLTTLSTVTAPTDLEAAFIGFLDRLRARGVAISQAELKKRPVAIPPVSKNSVAASKAAREEDESKEDFELRKLQCVKQIYTPSKFDASTGKHKPAAWYVALSTSGKGEKLTCATKFYDPSNHDVSRNPIEITTDKESGVSSRGELSLPVFVLLTCYWGQHGKTPAGMSMKFSLVQADWMEVEGGSSVYVPEGRIFGGGGGAGATIEKYKAITRDQTEFPDESEEEEDDGEDKPKAKPKSKAKAKASKKAAEVEEEEEEEIDVKPVAKKPKAKAVSKKVVVEEEEEEEEDVKPVAKKAKPKAKAIPKEIEEEEEEDVKPVAKKTKAKAAPKKKVVVEEEEEEEEEEA
jgi:hypothetical protein